jgi:hypothetical protein
MFVFVIAQAVLICRAVLRYGHSRDGDVSVVKGRATVNVAVR